ncbi:hypothetical protein MHK_010787 [Candidatus Magnetomorum sp. HK-1]|nr:hypothetical protein MHK_010787 [Candidatus Magnetomorum sp. HK-1]
MLQNCLDTILYRSKLNKKNFSRNQARKYLKSLFERQKQEKFAYCHNNQYVRVYFEINKIESKIHIYLHVVMILYLIFQIFNTDYNP